MGSAQADDWLLDSGATRNACCNKSAFETLDMSYKSSVEIANGQLIPVEGIGSLKLKFLDENGNVNISKANEVLYAPELVGNILSISRLDSLGFEIVFKNKTCLIKYENKVVGIADCINKLYILRQPQKINVAVEHKKNCIHHWHRKLGHRDPQAIKKMFAEKMADNMEIVECGIKEICETCMKGKLTRLPFPKKSFTKTKAPADLIHSDVCSLPATTPTGKEYVVTFIDDYSRYTTICLLKYKSEVEIKLKEFVEFIITKFNYRPKIIRSDRGGEYIGNEVKNYLTSIGIHIQLTAGYTPEQNGVAERKNRTLVEMARCMLIDAKLPKCFWGEAITTANYIQNRVFTSAINVTPYELWNQIKPNVADMHIFGSKCYVHVPKEKRQKLDDTGIEMVFIGYDSNSKAFRCYDPKTKKVTISRDVRFAVDLQKIDSDKKAIDMIDENGIQEEASVNEASMNETGIQQDPVNSNLIRISQRKTKGIPPKRLIDEIFVSTETVEPSSYNEAISCSDKALWLEAMKDEMDSLKENGTWEICDLPVDRTPIGCKWVYKIKRSCDGSIKRYKARLVGQGFSQQYGVDYDEVFAPVVRQTTFRTLLSIAGKLKMTVNHYDIKTAFLYGQLSETIYMKQPPGFVVDDTSKVCLLKKSIYGLKQAARCWYKEINKVLVEGGFESSKEDRCLYVKCFDDGNLSYILIYVDDLIVACKIPEHFSFIEHILSEHFELKNLGPVKEYLGLEISQDEDGNFQVCQSGYIKKIASIFGLDMAKSVSTPLQVGYYRNQTGEEELLPDNHDYRKLIGLLLYVSINSRPDIAASVSILSQKVSSPTQYDWVCLKHVVKYLFGTRFLKLKLSNVRADEQKLFGYADADFAEDRSTRKSNSGHVFFLNGGLISWGCRKQTVVSASSTEAEFIALSEACRELMWLKKLLQDMHQEMDEPSIIFEDNQSCLDFIVEEKFSNRMKHVDLSLHFVKDYVDKNMVKCVWCPTDEMIADLLTKPLPVSKHTKFRCLVGLQE